MPRSRQLLGRRCCGVTILARATILYSSCGTFYYGGGGRRGKEELLLWPSDFCSALLRNYSGYICEAVNNLGGCHLQPPFLCICSQVFIWTLGFWVWQCFWEVVEVWGLRALHSIAILAPALPPALNLEDRPPSLWEPLQLLCHSRPCQSWANQHTPLLYLVVCVRDSLHSFIEHPSPLERWPARMPLALLTTDGQTQCDDRKGTSCHALCSSSALTSAVLQRSNAVPYPALIVCGHVDFDPKDHLLIF